MRHMLIFALVLAACDGSGVADARSDELAAQGKILYGAACARCHGAEGRGGAPTAGGPAPRDFSDVGFQKARTDAQIRDAIVKGRSKGAMPPFGDTFTPDDLDALVAHLRKLGSREGRP
jgi:mono/diheme cytochrome c family protein